MCLNEWEVRDKEGEDGQVQRRMKFAPLLSEQGTRNGEAYLEGRRERRQLAWHGRGLVLLVFWTLQVSFCLVVYKTPPWVAHCGWDHVSPLGAACGTS